MKNENEKLVLEAMVQWCNQWTIEFLDETVLPNAQKFLDNEVCVSQLLKWYQAKQRNEKGRIAYIRIELTRKEGDAKFSKPYRDENQSKYNDVIYDTFKDFTNKI